jgi:hypothetical protein
VGYVSDHEKQKPNLVYAKEKNKNADLLIALKL